MTLNSNPLLVTLVLTSLVCFVQAQAPNNTTNNTTNKTTGNSTSSPGGGGDDLSCHRCSNGNEENIPCREGSTGIGVSKVCLTAIQFTKDYQKDIESYTLRLPIKLGKPRKTTISNTTGEPLVTLCVSLGFSHSARHYDTYTMRSCITDKKEKIEDHFENIFKVRNLKLPINDTGTIKGLYCASQNIGDKLLVDHLTVCFCNDKPNCNVHNHESLGCLARAWSGAVLVAVVSSIRLLGQFIYVD